MPCSKYCLEQNLTSSEFLELLLQLILFSIFQSERGKVSLDEFRALADQKPIKRKYIQGSDLEYQDYEDFSVEDFEETDEISLSRDK